MFAGGLVAYRIGDCKDGASQTFLIGETLVGRNPYQGYFFSVCNVLSTNTPPNYGLAYLDNCSPTAPVNNSTCLNGFSGFNSMHPGGLNMSTADGAVRFISETIDYAIWNHLGDKDDGVAAAVP